MTSRGRILFTIVCGLAACGHHDLAFTSRIVNAPSPPSLKKVLIRSMCGFEIPPKAPLPMWAPEQDEPSATTRAFGCPDPDVENIEYMLGLALHAAGYDVYPNANDFRDVSSNADERDKLASFDARSRRYSVVSADLGDLDPERMHESLGVDGVALVEIQGSKHCSALCLDVSSIVTIRLSSLVDQQPVWAVACEARWSESSLRRLTDLAAACAIRQIPHAGVLTVKTR